MLRRVVLIWLCIVPVAIVNGTIRDLLVVPYLGDQIARAISCLTLAGATFLIAWMSIRWMGPIDEFEAWVIGLVWLGLTLAFEFLVGHYAFVTPWEALLADYNILEGRLWILVLAAALSAPPMMFRAVQSPGCAADLPQPAEHGHDEMRLTRQRIIRVVALARVNLRANADPPVAV